MAGDSDSLFELIEPATPCSALIYSSPHSGNVYPDEFLQASRLSFRDLRRSADLFVDDLLIGAVSRGVPLIRAHFPRSFIDVNREPYELDPAMFSGRLPTFANTKSARVAAGYGTVARLVGESQAIYSGRIPIDEALARIDRYYLPYHAALRSQMGGAHRQFGFAALVDWHSMPSAVFPAFNRFDIVLGDRHGTSCSPDLIDLAEHTLRGVGLSVQRNQPYAGGFITEHYGNPVAGLHALQIEINRSLYMDETLQRPNQGFDAMRDALMVLTEELQAFGDWRMPIAAE